MFYKDKLYLGNEQIPVSAEMDNKERTANIIEYWFRGDNSNYISLHEFIGVHNKSISYRGCGCNQGLLNIIKAKVIETIKTNLNVNDIGEMNSDELKNQYGKIISIYKARTRKLLKNTDVFSFVDEILNIIEDIENNKIAWLNMLYNKNRYWFISENEQDKKEVEEFLRTYTLCNKDLIDDVYIAVLIIFKEYFLWQTCELCNGHYWKTIFSKKLYIESPKCTEHELYDWKKMWDNSKPIDLILSICYKEVYEGKIVKDKSDYKKFRNKLYKNIHK